MRNTLVLLLWLAGCHHDRYRGPTNLHAKLPPLPEDHFYSQYVVVHDGSRAAGVRELRARCEDPQRCTAVVVADGHWPELRVIGAQPGPAAVLVDYIHPGTGVREHRKIAFDLIATPAWPRLAIGARLPVSRGEVRHEVPARSLAPFMKEPDANVPIGACKQITAANPRDDTVWYACHLPVELEPGARFRTCANESCPVGDAYQLCAELAGGVIHATTVVKRSRDGDPRSWTIGTHRDPTACRP